MTNILNEVNRLVTGGMALGYVKLMTFLGTENQKKNWKLHIKWALGKNVFCKGHSSVTDGNRKW